MYRGRGIFCVGHIYDRHALVTSDVDGNRCLRCVAVRVRDGIGEGFRKGLALRNIHPLVQLVAVGAIRVQSKLAVLSLYRLAKRTSLYGSHGLAARLVCAEQVIAQHIAAICRTLLCGRFCQGKDIVICGWHIVHDGDDKIAIDLVASRVCHVDGDLVRHGVVALTLGMGLMFLQRIGVAHLAIGDTGDKQRPFACINRNAFRRNARVAAGVHGKFLAAYGHCRGLAVQGQRDFPAGDLLVCGCFGTASIEA